MAVRCHGQGLWRHQASAMRALSAASLAPALVDQFRGYVRKLTMLCYEKLLKSS